MLHPLHQPRILPNHPAVVLAPMEGVTDAPMRTVLTELGGLSFCVSEFLRINHELLPHKVYLRHVPEFESRCQTPSGIPIQIQLLGSNEEILGLSAVRACELGAQAIDINFGCPAPTVNRHEGGASLLRYPDRIQRIVRAVRSAVPREIPVSAKLRLGWDAMEQIYETAEQAALGGADWLTIHARTKTQGYTPPAHWKYIGDVKRQLGIPIVANGEIWNLDDFRRCRDVTDCEHFMLGRGLMARPSLAGEVARELGITLVKPQVFNPLEAEDWEPLLLRFADISAPISINSQYTARRIKQWIKFAAVRSSIPWFEEVKRASTAAEILAILHLWPRH